MKKTDIAQLFGVNRCMIRCITCSYKNSVSEEIKPRSVWPTPCLNKKQL